ncbi:MAG: AI-2E family transporter [Acetobacteraceae bacterium]|nr:AI-2E family transporter [Acetobacteraceae bacterium]
MQKQIVVSVESEETRVALLENGEAVELYIERPVVQRVVGCIYKGRVENVLPGMEAAFVDIGLERNAFLYVDDAWPPGGEEDEDFAEDARRFSIKDILKGGQEVLVQVVKEPIGTKGARVTRHITLPGRYLVLMPVVAYYLLLDWSAVVARVLALVPPRWRLAADGLAAEVDAVLGQYLRGQLLVMGALAVFYTAGLALVGLKLALPIGVFTGLAVFVPYLGFGLGLVLALLAAVLQFQSLTGVLLVGAVYAAGQVIESFFLTPRLVGERIGLHPIAVIFALMAFGHLFGFVGVLIALPASAVLLVAVRRLQALYVSSPWYRLREAAPPRGED